MEQAEKNEEICDVDCHNYYEVGGNGASDEKEQTKDVKRRSRRGEGKGQE